MSKQKPTKFCTKCNREFSLNGFYVKDKKSGKRFSWCKECHKAISKTKYQPVPKTAYVLPESKACTKCFLVKPIDQFQPRGDDPKRRRSHCIDCRRIESHEYGVKHKKIVDKRNAEYRLRLKDVLPERQKQWRISNLDRYKEIHRQSRARNQSRVKAYNARWRRENKETCQAAYNRRRARIKGNGGSYTAAEWRAIKAAQDYTCLMCGKREPEINLTVDHVISIYEGGLNTAENIQGLCKLCNCRKHKRTLDLREPK